MCIITNSNIEKIILFLYQKQTICNNTHAVFHFNVLTRMKIFIR